MPLDLEPYNPRQLDLERYEPTLGERPPQPYDLDTIAREAALTVLEPFHYKNLMESGKSIGRGLKDIATLPFAPGIKGKVEQGAHGISAAGGGALGLVAPVLAAAGGPVGIAALGPVGKGLGYATEKAKQGIEYVSPASKDYPELTGLAANAATLAAGGKIAERLIQPRTLPPKIDFQPKSPTLPQELPVRPPGTRISEVNVKTQPRATEAAKTAISGDLAKAFAEREAGISRNQELRGKIREAEGEIAAKGREGAALVERLGAERRKLLGEPPGGMAERRLTPERRAAQQTPEQIIQAAGGKYRGIQQGVADIPDHVLFDDPQSGTTLALAADQVTPEAVKAHIAESRAKYAAGQKPQSDVALRSSADPRVLLEAYTKHIGEPLAQAGKNLLKAAIGKTGLGPYLLERYGQPAEYIEAAKGRKTAIGIEAEKGSGLGQRLTAKLSQPQQESLGRFIKGEMSEADLRLVRSDARFADAVDAAKQARTEMDSLGGQAVMQGLFQEETFVKNYGKYLPRLYRKWEVDYDAALQKYGEKKPTRLDLSRFMRRQDIPEEVRLLMGEIKEPGYPVAKGISQLSHDVETAKLFNFVADNPKWSAKSLDELAAAGLKPQEFTAMPTTPKLGKLSGRLVQRYIADDLNQIIRTKSEAEKVGQALLSEWKYSKVVLNPATHSRNVMSNTLLAYLGGLPPVRLDIYGKALRELKAQGPIYREAQQAGLTGRTTFAGAEFDTLIDSWNATKGGPLERFARMGEKLRQRKPSEALKEIRPSQTKAGQKASELYQAEEQWFKMAKYMHNREKGMPVKEAAADAQKWLFDYSEVPKVVDWARRSPFGAPFITFTYKALPAIAESAITHPWRLATIAYTLNTIVEQGEKSLGMGEQEKRRVEKVLPERFKGSMAKLSPKFLLLPWKDRYGQLQYLDLTYILPWGDIGETGATGMPQQLLSNPAFSLLSELKSGRSAYTGQEIVRPQATGLEAAADRAKFSYRQLSPSLAPGGYGFERLRKAVKQQPDYFGRTTSIPSAIASVMLGLKVNPVDLKKEGFFRQRELEQSMMELRKEAFKIRANRGLSKEQKREQLQRLREKAQSLRPGEETSRSEAALPR